MVLVSMFSIDKDALICDLAETYHILNYRALPVTLLATLSCGLRDDSRIKMKMAGIRYVPWEFLLASIADNTTAIWHGLFAKKNTKTPTLYHDFIIGNIDEYQKVDTFASGEDFMKAIGQPLTGE